MLAATVVGCAKPAPPPPPEVAFDGIFQPLTSVTVSTDSNDALIRPTFAGVLGDDLIVVDLGAANLKVIDRASGKLERLVGGPGDEVGDFRQPLGIAMLSDSLYAVLDHKRWVVSLRDPVSDSVREVRLEGLWNGIAPSPRPGRFLLAGMPNTYLENRTTSLHEYDLTGHQTATCGVSPKSHTQVEESFNTPFIASLGETVLVGRYNSNQVQLCSLESEKSSTIKVAAGWYKPIEWPKELGGRGTGVQKINSWAEQHLLMSGLFALSNGKFIAQFMTPVAGTPSYHYVVSDTTGRTMAISTETDRQILATRGDTLYWIERTANGPVQLGTSVLHEQTNTVVARSQ